MSEVKNEAAQKIPVFNIKEQHYTSRELSNLLRLSMSTLAEYRRKGIGPKYVVAGYRTYIYSKEEVIRFVEERTRASTSATQNYDLKPQR